MKKKLEVNLFYESIELHSLEKTILYYTSDWLIDWLNKRIYIYIHPSINTSSIHIPKNNRSNKNQITKVSHNKQQTTKTTQGQQQKEKKKLTKTQEYIKVLASQAVCTQICRSSKSRHYEEDQSKSLLTPKAKRESESIWSNNSLVFELNSYSPIKIKRHTPRVSTYIHTPIINQSISQSIKPQIYLQRASRVYLSHTDNWEEAIGASQG